VPKKATRKPAGDFDYDLDPKTPEDDFDLPFAKPAPKRKAKPEKVSAAVREGVLVRAGWHCEICGISLMSILYSIHHRTPRGMGGSKVLYLHNASNLLALCGSGTTGCHGYVESHREESYLKGWLIVRGTDPLTVPVLLIHNQEVYLDDDFQYLPTKSKGGLE
jgi:hypothetical protein